MSGVLSVLLQALLDALLSRGRAYYKREKLKEKRNKLARKQVEDGNDTSERFRQNG